MTSGKFSEILTPYPLSAFGTDLPGDGMKHNPEGKNSAVQPNASRPAHSIHFRVTFNSVTQYSTKSTQPPLLCLLLGHPHPLPADARGRHLTMYPFMISRLTKLKWRVEVRFPPSVGMAAFLLCLSPFSLARSISASAAAPLSISFLFR